MDVQEMVPILQLYKFHHYLRQVPGTYRVHNNLAILVI